MTGTTIGVPAGTAPLPPGPAAGRLRQTARWVAAPYPYLIECRERFGDVFTLRLHALGDVVLVWRPEHVKAVFALAPDHGLTGAANALMTPVLGEHSLFVLDGEAHQTRRAQLRRALNTRPPIDSERVRDITAQELRTAGPSLDANPFFRWLALRLVAHRVFGTDAPDDLRPLAARVRWLMGSLSSLAGFFPALQFNAGPITPGYWLDRQLQAANRSLADVVRSTGDASAETAVCAHLRIARGQEPPGPTDELLDPGLRDDLVTLLLAGNDTVASALSWALFWIARTPSVHDRLLRGPDAIAPGAPPEDLLANEYLEAVCLEALRITPVVDIVSRELTEPLDIGGWSVPAGALLSPAIFLAHRNPDVFDEPACFRPERFIGRRYRPDEYFPFGGAGRRCLGAALAIYEMRLVIGTVLSQFEVTPARDASAELRYARRNVTVAPAEPFRIMLRPR